MARGGPRVGAGRPRKGSERPKKQVEEVAADEKPQESVPTDAKKDPLDYMLSVMNDSTVSESRRDRMAVAAAPYLHPKAGESGKKEQKAEAAKKAEGGRFAPKAPPPARVDTLN